jgi:SAM-dependent methyltransferase
VHLGDVGVLDAGQKFDLLCAFEVIEHIEDDAAALSAWLSRLVPGGAVLVSVPAWPQRFGTWDRLVGHCRRYTPDQLDSTLREAGCATAEHVLYGWPLGFVTESVRNLISSRKPDAQDQSSMSSRTAASGRLLQPNRLAGLAVRIGVAPFAAVQKCRPTAGVGLIGLGTA